MPHTCVMNTETGDTERGAIPSDTFSARLVLVRHFAGRLSIEQAASAAGVNPEAWRRWEDGARPRDQVDVATAISEAHGIDRDWLIFGGPLTPSRGKPVKRSDVNMRRKPHLPVRPSDTRPNTRDDSSRSKSPAGAGRRASPVW